MSGFESVVLVTNLVCGLEPRMVTAMGWVERERASVVVGSSRRPTAPLRREPVLARSEASGVRRSIFGGLPRNGRVRHAGAFRGATTLEDQTLPLAIMAAFAALGTIQLILTW